MKRSVSVLAALLLLPVASGVVAAAPAYACDVNNHCYGIVTVNSSSIDGNQVDISPSCLSVTSGQFVTDELWLLGSGGGWVEAGYLQHGGNLNIGGITQAGRYSFWADLRPGSTFYAHVLQSNPTLTYHTTAIWRSASNSFGVQMGGITVSPASTSNSMSVTGEEIGSETTANSGVHSYGWWRNIQYRSGSWFSGLPAGTQSTSSNYPQQFSWISQPTSFNAGVAC